MAVYMYSRLLVELRLQQQLEHQPVRRVVQRRLLLRAALGRNTSNPLSEMSLKTASKAAPGTTSNRRPETVLKITRDVAVRVDSHRAG